MSVRGRAAFCVKCADDRPTYRRGGRRLCIVCREPVTLKKAGGWNAEKTLGPHSGKVRDSKQEAQRESVLQAMANAGRITELVYGGPTFDLEVYGTQAVDALLAWMDPVLDLPDDLEVLVDDVRRSRRLIGRYTPDATYRDHRNALVAEDVKGHKISRDFPLRAKLMEACHNLPVTIIRKQRGVEQWARGAGVRGPRTGSRLKGGR